MTEMGWGPADFLASAHQDESPAARAARLARLAEERQDRRDRQDEAERAAAVAERRDALRVTAMQAGLVGRSAADVMAEASRVGDEDAQYEDARKTMARIERRRESRQREAADQAQRFQQVNDLVSRSAPTVTGNPDLLAEAKHALAAARVDQMLARAAAGRRPFAAGGAASGCAECARAGATAAESAAIHGGQAARPRGHRAEFSDYGGEEIYR